MKIESGDLAAFPLTYLRGRAPTADAEIALSQLQADTLGAEIDDAITVAPALSASAGGGSLDAVDAGTVALDGTELTGLRADHLADVRRERMGFVFQQLTLLRDLGLLENIVLHRRRTGADATLVENE